MRSLNGERILVVGASSGIGRSVALQAAEAGASVVVAARRVEQLESIAAAGSRLTARPCDVRQAESCDQVVRGAVADLGGLDVLVYAAATVPLVKIEDTDAEVWQAVFETNVVGASLVCRAALPHLAATDGRAVIISASSVGRPLPGMGAYEVSKAALDELVRAWRSEHPEIGFSTVAVGPTLGTDVFGAWEPGLAGEMSRIWHERGYLIDNGPGTMSVEEAAGAVLAAITSEVDLRYVLALPAAANARQDGSTG
jgi:NAD(P)-dependent dehydrogenase (short-subunit alcohol dehydrogenase family)